MQLADIYGENFNGESVTKRYKTLSDHFYAVAKKPPSFFFSSPGRAEIIGNHTDHNLGKVIVSAITADIVAAVRKREDSLVEIYSDGFSPIRLNANDIKMRLGERGRSFSLVRGVFSGIRKRGYSFGGFTVFTQSNVFRGAGISSSAAFEILLAEIVNVLYLGGKLTPTDKAYIGQYAENAFFGKPCGLLDQTGIAFGGMNKIDFINASAPVVERISQPKGYTIVITNTGGNHSSLTEHYASIRTEMSQVAAYFGKKCLREVPFEEFSSNIVRLKKRMKERAILRAFHFYEENERVDKAADALERGDNATFLKQINDSGESSLFCLQNCFVPGSDIQPIPLALKLSKRMIKDGAVRIHGGGFSGSILAYVSDREAEDYLLAMGDVFGKENVFSTQTRNIGSCVLSV